MFRNIATLARAKIFLEATYTNFRNCCTRKHVLHIDRRYAWAICKMCARTRPTSPFYLSTLCGGHRNGLVWRAACQLAYVRALARTLALLHARTRIHTRPCIYASGISLSNIWKSIAWNLFDKVAVYSASTE